MFGVYLVENHPQARVPVPEHGVRGMAGSWLPSHSCKTRDAHPPPPGEDGEKYESVSPACAGPGSHPRRDEKLPLTRFPSQCSRTPPGEVGLPVAGLGQGVPGPWHRGAGPPAGPPEPRAAMPQVHPAPAPGAAAFAAAPWSRSDSLCSPPQRDPPLKTGRPQGPPIS